MGGSAHAAGAERRVPRQPDRRAGYDQGRSVQGHQLAGAKGLAQRQWAEGSAREQQLVLTAKDKVLVSKAGPWAQPSSRTMWTAAG